MKRLLISTALLAFLVGGAIAQTAGAPPPPAPAPLAQPQPGMATPPPPPGMADDDDGGPPPPPHGRKGPRPPPPPMSRAAHVHLQRGDLMLDVKCADDEPTRACADTVMPMLDRLQAGAKP